MRLRPLGAQAALVAQRYVVTGARDAEGMELPRCSLLLTATITATAQGWQAQALQLSMLAD
jgi:hypothetical protein